jgi:hypothetical protein
VLVVPVDAASAVVAQIVVALVLVLVVVQVLLFRSALASLLPAVPVAEEEQTVLAARTPTVTFKVTVKPDRPHSFTARLELSLEDRVLVTTAGASVSTRVPVAVAVDFVGVMVEPSRLGVETQA